MKKGDSGDGIVANVQGNGTWDSSYGTMYQFDYTLEDGTAFQANHKTPDPIAVGTRVYWECKRVHETYGATCKVSTSAPTAYGGRSFKSQTANNDTGIKVGHAINNAVQLVIHSGKTPTEENLKNAARFILKLSDELNAEVNANNPGGEKAEQAKANFQKALEVAQELTEERLFSEKWNEIEQDNDLPF